MSDQEFEVEDQRSSTTNSVEFEVGEEVITTENHPNESIPKGSEGYVISFEDCVPYPYRVKFPQLEISALYTPSELESLQETDMSVFTEFAVKVNSPQESRLYQEIALEHGFLLLGDEDMTLFERFDSSNHYKYITFYEDKYRGRKSFTGNDKNPQTDNVLESPSYSDFVDALNGEYDFGLEPIQIGGKTVEFYEDHIEVGCTSVDNETVKEIHDRIQSN